MNDFSYALFEKKLTEDELVSDLDSAKKIDNIVDVIDGKSFVKVKAKVTFNDMNLIKSTLLDFNKIGKTLAHITNFEEISKVRGQLEKARSNIKDRNQKSKLEQQIKDMTNINKLAREGGLQMDQEFLNDFVLVLNYGFQDQLEIRMELSGFSFSANLKRECLREDESLIIRKYAGQTEADFVLFGAVTQYQGPNFDDVEEKEESENMKVALMNLVSILKDIESTFTGRLSNQPLWTESP